MANKEKTWEERIAHARAVNSQKKSAGVNNAPAVKTVSASSGQTKSWDDRIAHAKRVNAAKKLDEHKKLINSNEYKWASENEKRLKSGLGYNVNNGQIYSFEPITRDSLQKSIAWADSEIKKLKEKGGHSTKVGEWTDKLLTYAGYGDKKKDRISEAEEIAEASARLRELEGQRAVYSKYLENLQVKEDVEKLDSDIYAKNKIGAIFNIDNEQKLYFLNAGEDGYDNDTYYNNSVKRDKLVKELQEMGYDDVDRYIESYAKSRNKETFAPILEYIEKGMVKHPVLGAAATTAINAVTAPIQGVGQAFDNIAEAAGIHGYSAASFPGMVSDLSKTTVHKVIDENIDNTFLNKLSKVAYNAATNIVENSFVNKTFDKLSEGVLGLNAATSTYKAGKERGLSDGQALANGIAAGIFETLFEHISLEKLRAFQASPSTTLKPFIKNVLKQLFAEGSEELFTDVANEAYDYFVNGGLSQYEQALRSGVSSKEYGQQFLAQLGETFITGALAGGGMIGMSAAPSAVSGSVSQVLTDKAVGSNIRQYGDVEKTISTAKEQGGSLGKKAAKIEKQIAEGESVSDRRIGQIDRKTTKIERAKAVDAILAGKDFKDISGKEKNAIRSSVLTLLSSGEVSYEQAEVLETENGRKALEAAQRWEIDKVLESEAERIERKSNDIRKALDDNNTETLVKNTFSAVNAEGHKVSVGAVRSITDGEFEVVQDAETGATAKLSELKIEDRQARELYKNLQELATGENPLTVDAVNVALSMYNTLDNTSARAYSLWVHDAYKAGSVSIKNTVLSFPEFEEMFHNKYDGDIKEQQLREIYEIGARNLKVNPGVTRIGRKGLSKLQAEQVFILHERAKQLGLEIVLTDGRLTDENGKGVNALYIEGTNRIVMSLQNDLGLTLVHAGHEIFHWGKSQNKANGEYLQNMVIGVLKSDSKYDFDGIYKQVSAEYEGISEEAILEEIAAQYLGVVFANEDSIRRTVATATAEQKSFLQKMVEYLKDFIKSIKKLIDLYGDRDKTVRAAVTTPTEQLQYIADTFEEVLRKTAEIKKPATETGGVKASRQFNNAKINNEIINLVNRVKENNFKPNEIVDLGTVNRKVAAEIMNLTGFDVSDYSVVIEARQIEHILKDHGENGKTDHSLSDTADIAKMGFVLNDPDSISNAGRTQAYSYMEKGHNRTAKTVLYEKRIGEKSYYVVQAVPITKAKKLFVVSAFIGEQGYKKEASQLINANSPDATTEYGSAILSNNTVSQNTQSVNNNDMQNEKKDSSLQIEADKKTKYSRQLLDYVEDSVDQLKAENYSFGEYVDKLTAEINAKISGKRSPGSSTIFNREEFINIAKKYNTFYKKNENGGYNQLRYSDSEIANAIERVLVGISEGVIDAKKGVTLLARMQVDILSDGYVVEDDAKAKEFRQFVRNKPIYLSPRDFAELVDAHGGSKKTLRAASFHQLSFKEAEAGQRADIGVFYETARKLFPEFLKEVITPIEMAEELINAEKSLRPTVHYASEQLGFSGELEMREAAIRRAADILREAFNAQTVQGDFTEQYKELITARKSYDKLRQYNKKLLENASKSYYEVEKKETTYKRIIRNAKRLDDMLRNETDQRHIPENLKKPVAKLLSVIAPFTEKRSGKSEYNNSLSVTALLNAYKEYGINDNVHYDDEIEEQLKKLQFILTDDVDIKKLSYEALSIIDDVVKHFAHLVKTGNEMFVNGRKEEFANIARKIINESVKKYLPEGEIRTALANAEYGMLTPIYFFKSIGTRIENGTVVEETLFKMFNDLRKGQDDWYKNILKSRELFAQAKASNNYSERWKEESVTFNLESGAKITLTFEEIMYMWALYKREQKSKNRSKHILSGGIMGDERGRTPKLINAIKNEHEVNKTRKELQKQKEEVDIKDLVNVLKKEISQKDLLDIFATLTDDMKNYTDAVVKILSTTGADLGNAVSRELFGIDKYKEEYYIPICVATEYLATSPDDKKNGKISIKSRSFTKRTTQDADAPVYVKSITDIAAEHMQEMSLYNAMTIPLENFTRVLNYKLPDDVVLSEEGGVKVIKGDSLKDVFKSSFGQRAVKYLDNFIDDMNGGNQTTSRDFMSKMMSMYKKSAVTGSLSVAVQQPSALVRAMALVDPKYFVTKPYSKEDYLEMLEYCPVAGIKEIGRFDTGTGLTATEWILDESGGIKDRADALLSYLPGWMDRRTWVYIWEAVKKETADKTKLKGEELLTESAKRFRDVIDYTQVYDSTLSRSAFMRDKGTGAKMATAFLSEPTLSYNMVRDGLLNAKNDKKQAARSVAAFAGATLLNAMLKTLVTALRHDDEETNYFEVYLSEMPQNFFEDMIIVNSLPVVKDVISIFKGYDVNRSDMTLFSNVYNAFKVISKEGHIATWDEWFSLFGAISAFTGIPLNNVVKDFNAVIKTVTGLSKSPEFSWDVLGQTITETLLGKADDSVKIYRAILNGNKEIADRYLIIDEKKVQEYVNQGYSEADALNKAMDNAENNFHNKVVEGLVSEDIRIKEAAEARLEADTAVYEALLEEMTDLGFDRNDVIRAVEKYISSMEDKTYESSEKKDKAVYTNSDLIRFAESFDSVKSKSVIAVFKENGKEDGDIRKSLTEVFKPQYIEAWRDGNTVTVEKIRNFLVSLDVGYKESSFNKWEKEANSKE